MKIFLCALLGFCLPMGFATLSAETVDPGAPGSAAKPASQELLLAELDRRRPSDTSPFFADRETAAFMSTPEGRLFVQQQEVPTYPNTASYDSVGTIVGTVFGGFFRAFQFQRKQPGDMISLKVIPGATFPLSERREITVTFQLTNQGRDLMKLGFPTQQRFDVVVRDAAGTVIERWSDDRSFGDQEAVVMINPGEKIEYSATLSTREMQAGQPYTVEVSVHDHPQFARTVAVNPI